MSKPLPLVLALLLAIPFCSYSAPSPSGAGDSAVKDKHITARVAVTPAFSFVLQGTCMPISVDFIDNSIVTSPDAIVSWSWDFDDGNTDATQNPTHVFTSPRTYNVKLTITDNSGNTYTIINPVIIPDAYTANIPLPFDTTKCSTDAIMLDAGVPATSYQWYGPESGPTKTITTFFGGTYELDVDSNGCQTVFYINVNDLPPVDAEFSYINTSCTPVQVTFSDLSHSCGSSVVTWDWDFGDGSPHSNQQNPVHTYAASGQYFVTLTTIDGNAATATSYPHLVIAGTPAVDLGPDSTICSDGITLDAGSNGQVDYLWSTGPGGQYIHPVTVGTYWVRASNNGCVASDTMVVLGVRPSVRSNFTYSPPASCAPLTVTFTDLSEICNEVEYERTWEFGDGNTLTETYSVTYPGALPPTITHDYAAGGSYLVKLTVMNSFGTLADTSYTIIINDGTVNLGNDTIVCPGTVLTLNAGAGATSYAWNTGATTQTISVNTPGKYWVDISNGGCNGSDTIVITQKRSILTNFGYQLQSVCLPITVQFSDSSVTTCGNTITQWDWDFADGNTSTQQNPSHNFAAGGTYNVRLILTDNLGIKDTAIIAVVVPNAAQPALNLGNDTTVCNGTVLHLDGGTPASAWTWSTGATTQILDVSAAGTYWVQTDNNGCIRKDTIVIATTPAITADYSYAQTVCLSSGVTFTDLSASCGGTLTNWQWDFGDGNTSATQNPVHIYAAAGSYTVTLNIKDSNDSTTQIIKTVVVTGGAQPVLNLGNDTTICASTTLTLDAGNAGATYLWSTGVTSQTIGVTSAGTYWVKVDNSGCTASDTITVGLTAQISSNFNYSLSSSCLPVTASFTDVSTACGATVTGWQWDFGDGNTSTAQNPSHIYVAGGSYLVTLTATSSNGNTDIHTRTVNISSSGLTVDLGNDTAICASAPLTVDAGNAGATYLWSTGATSQTIAVNTAGTYWVNVDNGVCASSDTIVITVKAPLAANFSSSLMGSCLPLPVKFTDASTTACSNTIISWSWDFGDGNTSTSQNPTHSFTAGNTYTVQLTITDNLGATDVKSTTVTIPNAQPTALSLGNDTTICSGATLMLDAGTPATSYTWSTGAATQTISVTTAGTYSVQTNNNGCIKKDTIVVTVNPAITAAFTQTQLQPCLPADVSFTDNSASCAGTVVSWSWNFGDGNTSTTQSPVHTYAAAGTYNVSLTVTDNNSATISITKPVTVTGGTTPVVNLGNDTAVCAASGLTMNAGNVGATYLWSTGATSQTITAFTAGTYWVRVNNSGCIASDTLVITAVTPSITTDFTHTGGAVSCLPAAVNFTDITTSCAGAVNSWSWNFGDGGTSTQQNPSHNYAAAGTYTVTLIAKNSGGFSQTKTHTVTVTGSAPVNLGSDVMICEGTSVTLDAGPGSSYTWNTGATTQTISASTAGSYIVNVTNGSCNSKDTIVVAVSSSITPNYTYTVQPGCGPIAVKFKDVSLATCVNTLKFWRWDFNDGFTSTQQNPTHNYAAPGSYQVILKVTDNRGFFKYDTQTVVVAASPITVNLGKDTIICAGASLTLDAGNAGATYIWSTGQLSQQITVSASGIYYVQVNSGTCSKSDTIAVNFVPGATPKFGYNIASACLPVLVKFTDSTIVNCSAPIVSWSWNFGDGNTSTQQHPQHTYLATGTFNVTMVATAADGKTFNASKNVVITNTPLNVNLGADLTTCLGTGVLLDAGNTGATYKWTPATGLSSDTIRNPVARPLVSTMYKVTVTRCTLTAKDSIMVLVDSVSKPTITQSGNKLSSSYALSYQWYKDSQLIPGADDRTYKPRSKGFYTVRVSNGQGCEAVSDPKFFIPASDLDPHVGKIHVKLSPNPGHGIINVYLDKFPESTVIVKVIDLRGKQLLIVSERSQVIKLNMTPYCNGLYFVVVIIGKEMTAVPLIIF